MAASKHVVVKYAGTYSGNQARTAMSGLFCVWWRKLTTKIGLGVSIQGPVGCTKIYPGNPRPSIFPVVIVRTISFTPPSPFPRSLAARQVDTLQAFPYVSPNAIPTRSIRSRNVH